MTNVKSKRMMTISQLNYLTKNKVIANNRTLGVVGEDDADGADDEEVDDDGSDEFLKKLENS